MGNRTSQLLPQELRKVAHHLSAAKQAEKHVVAQRNEAKRMDPDGKMWERDDQLFNQMNALAGAITDSPEPRATPAGAVKKGAKRRVAGMVLPRERDEAPKYGLAEAELKSMLVLATADARNQDTPDVVELARNHDLDQKDVARVLHFCCPAMPVANSSDTGHGRQIIWRNLWRPGRSATCQISSICRAVGPLDFEPPPMLLPVAPAAE